MGNKKSFLFKSFEPRFAAMSNMVWENDMKLGVLKAKLIQ
jgi:hypothetical protein